jgi:hypothetical protein
VAALCRAAPSASAFSRRVRALVFNLRDTKTPELRRRVIDAEPALRR